MAGRRRLAAVMMVTAGMTVSVGLTAVGTPRADAAALVARSLSFTADDGVVLHATVGATGSLSPRPLIVEDSPYAPSVRTLEWAGPAYNYVDLQWRGTGSSGGSLDSTGSRDQRDLSEFLGFACHQPWSDGRIGLYGFSASAIVVYNAMHLPLPCVRATALMAGTVDLYRDLLYVGGIPNSAPGAAVEGEIGADTLANGPARASSRPGSIPVAAGGYVTTPAQVMAHQTEDAFWRERTFTGDADHIPVLADTSFYDVEERGPFLAYEATRQYGSHLLVMGAHDGFPAGTPGPFPRYAAWFDHYVRGVANGVEGRAPVSLYLSNGSRERFLAGHYTNLTGSGWPLPGTTWTRLYLSAHHSGTVRSLNDGSLSLGPQAPVSRQGYPFVPSEPTETDPHTVGVVAPEGIDQAATVAPALTDMALSAPTSLTYTSAPLARAVDAVGPASLDVFVSSTAPETDLVAVLADVAADGAAHPVETGQLRTS
ncbi:MAG TPA: CocE/NonD family hydrolase, partial [Acidimicrobiales bacterium]|nr:CocE/NonD family hydrolase [Acidimicrobiales bacterium]